ncbi:MAG: hypothetical protein NTY60_10895 [Proteobacteria bacterium]|nr:hypothetical protein [Pseudomonadota bacterium]
MLRIMLGLMFFIRFAVAGPLPDLIAQAADSGIRFACPSGRLAKIESGMDAYLSSLEIRANLVVKKAGSGALLYTLNSPVDDSNTLDFNQRPELQIHDEIVTLPAGNGRKKLSTVSRKEIMLALLQHGRLTEFKDEACDIEAVRDHVAIRQNIVAWAENLTWIWPDGGYAKWNNRYWQNGTPRTNHPLHEALNDVFMNQHKYSIGCYTATKLVVMQGVLDYYRRIKRSPDQLELVEDRITFDKDPLVSIEPAKMWAFEKGFDPQDMNLPGKLLKIKQDVMPMNFVPGDWIYLLNTDPVSNAKTGYEGSNAIYLGRNKFDDYYNDNHHSYSYFQKLDEVYQWRNGVFSRSRDFQKIKPLMAQDLERLSRPPAKGGLLKTLRVTPYFFAFEDLPVLAEP